MTAWVTVPSFAAAARCNDRCRSALHLAWLALSIALAIRPAQARAEASSTLEIVLEAESCPRADVLKSMLAPLLSEAILLSAEQVAGPDARRVRVRDLGAEYAIELEHSERRQRDPERDCEERARVAAVFIALNVNPKSTAEANTADATNAQALASSLKPAPATSSGQPAASASSNTESPARGTNRDALHVGLGAFASVMFAPEQTTVAPGGGATVWLELSALRLALSAALMGKVALPLAPREPGGSAELWRVPLAASVGYLWHASRFALSPSLGIALDVLRMQGRGLGQSEHALRLNVGVDLELVASIALRERLALLASVNGAWFPRAYELRVEPAPRRAEAPELWLAGQLGIAFMLR